MIEKYKSGFGRLIESYTENRQYIHAGSALTSDGLVQLFQVRDSYGKLTGWQVRVHQKARDFKTRNEAVGFVARTYDAHF